jgi:hypothetical protein
LNCYFDSLIETLYSSKPALRLSDVPHNSDKWVDDPGKNVWY